jgi:hypothetical protein
MRDPRKILSSERWLRTEGESLAAPDRIYLRRFLRRILQLGIASTISCTSLWMSVRLGAYPQCFISRICGR